MKITLDISKLVEEGNLTPAEAERLKALAAQGTGSLGLNILVGFGVVSVAAGLGALVPNVFTAMVIGAAIFALGIALTFSRAAHWWLLAQICTVLGALVFCSAILVFSRGALVALLLITAWLAVAGVIARSGLLIAASVVSLGACLGAKAGYWHDTYALAIYEPLLTVLLFSAVGLATYQLSHRLSADYERLALMASRTSVLMVNFGFWIGSLWGDRLMLLRGVDLARQGARSGAIVVPSIVFSVAWAVALIAAGVWATRVNRRWLVNTATVFGTIHFYTQWFEMLGATPLSVLLGGLALLGIAIALWNFNRPMAAER